MRLRHSSALPPAAADLCYLSTFMIPSYQSYPIWVTNLHIYITRKTLQCMHTHTHKDNSLLGPTAVKKSLHYKNLYQQNLQETSNLFLEHHLQPLTNEIIKKQSIKINDRCSVFPPSLFYLPAILFTLKSSFKS